MGGLSIHERDSECVDGLREDCERQQTAHCHKLPMPSIARPSS